MSEAIAMPAEPQPLPKKAKMKKNEAVNGDI